MNTETLQIENWKSLTARNRLEVAHRLAKQLPLGFEFSGIESHLMGDQQHEVAFYNWNPASVSAKRYLKGRFALITGAEVTLGYDPKNPFVPSVAQIEAWESSEYGGNVSRFYAYLAQCMTPLR